MCPDIETYAPLIVADFGLGDVVHGAHPAHRLRVRLADRSLIQTNPLLGVAAQLLALAGGRVTASEVLNLAQAAPVRARFGFTDDDLEAITRWVRQANIRWGFDQQHRRPYHVDFVHNTWRFGIDRMLAGVAMSDDSQAWIDTTLPLDDVGSNRVELAGQLAEFVGRLEHVVDALTGARPLREWLDALTDGIAMLTRINDADAWQTSQMQREFAEVLAQAGPRADTSLRLPDIRALLDRHLAGRPTRANFRTGTLTVCTMVPMRSVPHRVVCLVGLDDGVFPRIGVVDGDDVLARDPMTGERDIRSEDRQLLLDAIGAATEKLVITYTGANEYSGQPRPPAVPLAELLDTLDMTTPEKVRERIVVEHPLQPFDIRNVIPGELVPKVPFTFDPTVLRAAQVSAGERSEHPKFISGPLPPPPADDVALADLVGFFKDPVKGFFRALDFTLPRDVDGVQDAMPVDIDASRSGRSATGCCSDILRGMSPGSSAPGRVAPRHAAARSAGLAQGQRDPRPGRACWRPTAQQHRPAHGAGVRRRHRSRRRATAHRHGVAGVRRAPGVGDLLQAGRQAPAGVVDSVAGVDRSRSGPRLVGGVHRPPEARHHAAGGGAGAAATVTPSRCCVSWWRSTTRAAASRFRCPSRRPTPGRPRGTAVTTRYARREYRWKITTDTPARTRSPRTCGRGARTPGWTT